MESDLSSLETAIQAAGETVVPFGVDKVLLYITPPPTAEQIPTLYELAEQARSDAIHVNVWMVGGELFLANDQGKALQNLAAITGGQFFNFTGVEPVPSPAGYLAPFGSTYQLTYTSRITETGTYPLTLHADLPGMTLSGQAQPFYIEVLPPNPIFISPPASLTRLANPDAPDPLAALVPNAFSLEILIQFPDGHPREIRSAKLYVDGRLEDENTAFPYDTFLWDLSAYTESGEHQLQVTVVDELGLEGSTLITPVQIEVRLPTPEAETAAGLFGNPVFRAVGGGVLALGLLGISIWGLRRRIRRRKDRPSHRRIFGRAGAASAAGMARGGTTDGPLALLEPLDDILPLGEHPPLTIDRAVTTLGSAPGKVTVLISEETIADSETIGASTIAPTHARLTFLNGQFWLRDLGSSHGTWVNYEPIGTKDVPLKTGDVIHLGWIGFRFRIEGPPNKTPEKPIRVSPYEPDL
jgi:hypothetical protein